MKILLAGDSTVTTQPRGEIFNPKTTYCGWGQMLNYFFEEDVIIHNFAQSGLTTQSFKAEGHYSLLLSEIESGDFVLIQFGHNDQKLPSLRAEGGYTQELKLYISQLRERGAIPVLVTPVGRNSWRADTGEYNDLLLDYAKAVINVCQTENAPLLDLHQKSVNWIKSLGLQNAKRYFHQGDYTHPNDYGGFTFAKMVAQCILESENSQLLTLQKKLTHSSGWQTKIIADSEVDLATGWCASPEMKINPRDYSSQKQLTILTALKMAQSAFSYFVSQNPQKNEALAALQCAKENGYLPQNISFTVEGLTNAIDANAFEQLILLACKGRNKIFEGVKIPKLTQPLTEAKGAEYVEQLLILTSGCTNSQKTQSYEPKGS